MSQDSMIRAATVAGWVWLGMFGVALAQQTASWQLRDHLPIEQFTLQAHRGAGELSEENTLEAFELGWSLNCIPEADVRTTKDGVIVAFHDANFARVAKDVTPELAKQGVKDLTLDQLRQLDVGSWKGSDFENRQTPTLAEVFALMRKDRSRRLYLDWKDADLPQLAALVKKEDVESQVIFASTLYPKLQEWMRLSPHSQTLLWMRGDDAKLEKRFDELRATDFADVTQLQIHVHLTKPADQVKRTDINPFKETDAFLIARGEELRKRGILYQTLPYGGASEVIYLKLLDLGFMSFATDHPHITWNAVNEHYAE
ncbi:glycerophosphodiester phosphodiesterase [Blastopirellula retiformator]|uniref:Glycerophosphoryl diester phosphodiesterase n=1 Tax=Blastopirellula retiformator TaxID=2527970 RepID=A0A5C5UUZ3_9BACT|nr:glycerophosphodiester phosphodiesterase family protein [Blastopirellula retiformator]TWT29433.1 Glycerophosphoryl diester phosphodiesterase [Blastopirellula retiformator]